jgi:hypothetical protein
VSFNEYSVFTLGDEHGDIFDLYKPQIDALIEAGVIEVDHRHSTWDSPEFNVVDKDLPATCRLTVMCDECEHEQEIEDEIGKVTVNVAFIEWALKLAHFLNKRNALREH